MKNIKTLFAAAIAVMVLASCEPEQVVVPEPEAPPAGPTYLTSLTGTVWNRHEDYWLTVYGVDYHVLQDHYMTFLTDSTGTNRLYSPGAENVPAWDETNGFFYLYDTLTRTGIIEDSSAAGPVTTHEFRYDAELEAIFVYTVSSDSVMYTREQ